MNHSSGVVQHGILRTGLPRGWVPASHVILQMGGPFGTVRAVRTCIGLFPRVDAHVAAEVTHAGEGDGPAVGAHVWGRLPPSVHLVPLQREPYAGVT